jgi:aspartyl-tRNA(Asn)/glutamyl-tRNA(Gln) amidotransferase subunit A
MTENLHVVTISSVRSDLLNGTYSAAELMEETFRRIRSMEPDLNCFLTLNDESLEEARRIARNDPRPLAGIPMTVKDLILTRDMPTTAGSRVPHPFRQVMRDAQCIGRLRRAGALIIGKTGLHEFAFGITNENEHFGPVHNPWDLERVSGGSSGGSAAALAARLGLGSVGTDTRGSIRIPASCCGVCGLKPTRGRIPTEGVIPLSPTLDHVGPMANSVADLEMLFGVLSPGWSRPKHLRRQSSQRPILGVTPYYFDRIATEVASAVDGALRLFEEAGFRIVDLEIPELGEVLAASDVISRAEAVSFHDPLLREFPEDYGPQVRERLMTGYDLSAVDFVRAEQQRRSSIRAFRRAFCKIDCLVCPTLPVTAPPLGTREIEIEGQREPIVPCFVRLVAPQNMAGVPSLSIPCGFSRSGLPVGLQLIAGHHRESVLFEVGKFYQERTDWHRRLPSLADR